MEFNWTRAGSGPSTQANDELIGQMILNTQFAADFQRAPLPKNMADLLVDSKYCLLFWYYYEKNVTVQNCDSIVTPRVDPKFYRQGQLVFAKYKGTPYRAVIVRIKDEKDQLKDDQKKIVQLIKDPSMKPNAIMEKMGVKPDKDLEDLEHLDSAAESESDKSSAPNQTILKDQSNKEVQAYTCTNTTHTEPSTGRTKPEVQSATVHAVTEHEASEVPSVHVAPVHKESSGTASQGQSTVVFEDLEGKRNKGPEETGYDGMPEITGPRNNKRSRDYDRLYKELKELKEEQRSARKKIQKLEEWRKWKGR